LSLHRLSVIGCWLSNGRVCERICGLKCSLTPDGCSMASAHPMSRKLIAVLHRIPLHRVLIDLDAELRPAARGGGVRTIDGGRLLRGVARSGGWAVGAQPRASHGHHRSGGDGRTGYGRLARHPQQPLLALRSEVRKGARAKPAAAHVVERKRGKPTRRQRFRETSEDSLGVPQSELVGSLRSPSEHARVRTTDLSLIDCVEHAAGRDRFSPSLGSQSTGCVHTPTIASSFSTGMEMVMWHGLVMRRQRGLAKRRGGRASRPGSSSMATGGIGFGGHWHRTPIRFG
jgi:hypothetical protein